MEEFDGREIKLKDVVSNQNVSIGKPVQSSKDLIRAKHHRITVKIADGNAMNLSHYIQEAISFYIKHKGID